MNVNTMNSSPNVAGSPSGQFWPGAAMQIKDCLAKFGSSSEGSVIVLATPPAALAGWNEAGRQNDEMTGFVLSGIDPGRWRGSPRPLRSP